jgi:hypothetical protein
MPDPHYVLREHCYDLTAKLQYIVDLMDDKGMLSDGGFTFPDGDFWQSSRYTRELKEKFNNAT